MSVPAPILGGQRGDNDHCNGEDETDDNEEIVDAGTVSDAKPSIETEHDHQKCHGDADDIHNEYAVATGRRVNVVWRRPLGHDGERRKFHGGNLFVPLCNKAGMDPLRVYKIVLNGSLR